VVLTLTLAVTSGADITAVRTTVGHEVPHAIAVIHAVILWRLAHTQVERHGRIDPATRRGRHTLTGGPAP
jgi:hypothetical protein